MTRKPIESFRLPGIEAMLRYSVAVSMIASLAWGSPPNLAAGEEVMIDELSEGSVLVVTREDLESEYETPNGSLEPISGVSEHEPSPAKEPTNEEAPKAEPAEQDAPTEVSKPEPGGVTGTPRSLPSNVPGDVASALIEEERLIAAAPFRGMVAGQSSKQELIQNWGAPSEVSSTEGGDILHYDFPHFKGVDVLIESDVVSVIRAELQKQAQPKSLAAKLRVDVLDPAKVVDHKTGETLGIAYPEKGLLLLLSTAAEDVTPLAPQFVTHIVLQSPEAEAFALRAESRPPNAYGKRLKDLSVALSINPKDPYALWVRSGVYLETKQPVKAQADASLALEQDKTNQAYQLRLCETLAAVGRYDEAVLSTRKVIDDPNTPELVKAQAVSLMGRMASLGESDIADKAIGFHTTAISIADELATSKDDAERRAAKRLLVTSHLDIAIEVSRRSYDDKSAVVAQWIGRASGLAEEMISNDNGSLQLRLLVARKSLEALANFKPSKDPSPFVKEASESAAAILASTDDPLQRHQAHWELGQAYFHALRVSHSRREADQAIAYGNKAIDHLAAGAESGDVRPEAENLVGRLYFHIGAAYAVHQDDHQSALEWYDRALPLLNSEAPKNELVVPRQLGESLVSMGVSYWDQSQQQQAVELTVKGASIMETAVKAGVLDKSALGVPYGNLATMHSRLGDGVKSAHFAKMAANARTRTREVANKPATATPKRSANSQRASGNNGRTATRQPNRSAQRATPNAQPNRRSGRTRRGTIVR